MKNEFKNLREVTAYLRDKGWRVSQSTVYEHAKKGMIKPDKEGVYTLKSAQRYARIHLMMQDTHQKIGDEELQRKKLSNEIELKQEQIKRERIKRMAEEGRYIERDLLDLEMAARAAALEAGLKYMIQAKAGDWIEIVSGDMDKAGDLIRKMTENIDALLNDFATKREFQVILKAEE